MGISPFRFKIAQDGPKMAQDGAKMASRWPQDRPKMAQDGPKLAPRRPKKAPGWPQVASYRDLIFIFSSASCRYLPRALRRPSRAPSDPPGPIPRTPKDPPGAPPDAPRRPLRGSRSSPLIHSESRSTSIRHSGYICGHLGALWGPCLLMLGPVWAHVEAYLKPTSGLRWDIFFAHSNHTPHVSKGGAAVHRRKRFR